VQGRGFLTTGWLVLLTGLTALNLAGLWAVSQSLRVAMPVIPQAGPKQPMPDPPPGPAQSLDERLTRMDNDRVKLATDLASASDSVARVTGELAKLSQDLADLRLRLKVLEEKPQAERKPNPAIEAAQLPHVKDWVERMKRDPEQTPVALRRAFVWKGAAGLGHALGMDEAGQAKLQRAYDLFLARVRAVEKEHARVRVEGAAVHIQLEAFPEEGQRLREEWGKTLAEMLTPEQAHVYKKGGGDAILFDRGIGERTLSLVVTRNGNMYNIRRQLLGPKPGETSHGTISVAGDGALEALPDRHLLTDEALARLREQ